MAGSTAMGVVPGDIRDRFNAALKEWLPGARVKECLYRGSRDGMTPVAFHTRCDGKGATLTVIRADVGESKYVFGGYSRVPWMSPPDNRGEFDTCSRGDAFLFSVVSPHPTGTVCLYPLKPGQEKFAICHSAACGPVFGRTHDLYLGTGGFPKGPYTSMSYCGIAVPAWSVTGTSYEDTIEKGVTSFTGAQHFVPVEVEVFLVVPVAPSESV